MLQGDGSGVIYWMDFKDKKLKRPAYSPTGNKNYLTGREARKLFKKYTYYFPGNIIRRLKRRIMSYMPLFIREGIPFLGDRRKWLLWVILILVVVLLGAVKQL